MARENEERVVLVTGSSSGLGAALIEDFASRGFGVVINYIIEEQAEAFYRKLAETHDEKKLMKYKADVANREQVKAMFDAVIEQFGRIDVLVNTAGINRDASFLELTDENWDAVVSAHLKGHFVCGQEYAFHKHRSRRAPSSTSVPRAGSRAARTAPTSVAPKAASSRSPSAWRSSSRPASA